MIRGLVTRFAQGLRFPTLFGLVAGLFLLDLAIPDLVPFADEILLAFGTVLLGSLRRKRGGAAQSAPPAPPVPPVPPVARPPTR